MDYHNLIPFLTASILLTLMPGPDIIYVIMQSIANGKKYGIITALGLVSGIIVHVTLIAFGVSAIITNSETLFFSIKLLGASYLFYLAFKTYKSSSAISLDNNQVSKKASFSLFKQGFIMNVLNPKVILFFLAFFPGFIDESKGDVSFQIYILGFLFMLQAFIVFSLVSVFSSRLTVFLRNNQNAEKYLKYFQVIIFIAIGIYILI